MFGIGFENYSIHNSLSVIIPSEVLNYNVPSEYHVQQDLIINLDDLRNDIIESFRFEI